MLLGVGSAAVTAWDIEGAVLLIIFALMLAVLYWASLNARHGLLRVAPGGLLAVVVADRIRPVCPGRPTSGTTTRSTAASPA